MVEQTQDPAEFIRGTLDNYPALTERLVRQLLTLLHTQGIATVDQIYDEARRLSGEEPVDRAEADPNAPSGLRWEGKERNAVLEIGLRHASRHLTAEQARHLVYQVRRREEAESLENIANLPGVPFRLLADRVRRYCALPKASAEPFSRSGNIGTRVALIRNFISDQLEFIGVSKNYLRIRDFEWLIDRVIGTDKGQGRIGGKAAGILLGSRILEGASGEHQDDPISRVRLPESWFLRSDVIEQFLTHNGLEEYQSQKYKSSEEVRNEYPLIRQVFHNGEFPPDIVDQLEKMLKQIRHHPVIVRSSSLLEDRFGAAFSGMYSSIFLGNQGSLKDRLRALLGGIADVFASTLSPDPILYRRRHNLIDYNEGMAILIQKVVGRPHGRYFLPDVAGVAFSRNEYRWSPRIRTEDGMARVVLGLGTRAVDRTGDDYSRIVALGAPQLRPEVTPDKVIRYSQRFADVIDLQEDRFRRVPIGELLSQGPGVPGMTLAASLVRDGAIVEPVGAIDGEPADRLCLTFDRLLNRTPFAHRMREQLKRLEDSYGVPINVEYAINGNQVYLLQCRPLVQAEAAEFIRLPRGIPIEDRLFYTREIVRSGEIRDIDYLVYADPWVYDALESREARISLGRTVGRINDALEDKTFVLLGPGRWGSNDSALGVKVSYADINHCKVLIEIAHRKGGYVPEVSYGTHFFQELVEDGIYYLPLHQEQAGVLFNSDFFKQAPNCLAELVPQDADRQDEIRVIRVAEAAPGRRLHLVMDGDAGESMCWLESRE
jgi:hypothetical protein